MDILEKAAVTFACGILGFQLFVPPAVGLANNGDFGKLLGRYCLAAPVEDEFKYAPLKYRFAHEHCWDSPFHSSAEVLILAAFAANSLFLGDRSFDIRFMGLVQAGLWVLALAALLPVLRILKGWRRAAGGATFVVVFSDAFYATHFNSFYMDAAALVFLAWTVCFAVRCARQDSWFNRAGFLAAGCLMLAVKTQHSMLAFPLAALALFGRRWLWPRAGNLFRAAAALLLVLAGWLGWRSSPAQYKVYGLYSVVFSGVLPNCPDAGGCLKDLGLDDSYLRWSGTHAYSEGSPVLDPGSAQEFSARTSYFRLAVLLAKQPSLILPLAVPRWNAAGRIRPALGNYDRRAGKREWEESQAFAVWGPVKRRLLEGHGFRYAAFFGILAVLLCAAAVRARAHIPAMPGLALTLTAMAALEFVLATFGDAVDAIRHFVLFNAMQDFMMVAGLIALMAALQPRGPSTSGSARRPAPRSGP